jgi:hypothetical protein
MKFYVLKDKTKSRLVETWGERILQMFDKQFIQRGCDTISSDDIQSGLIVICHFWALFLLWWTARTGKQFSKLINITVTITEDWYKFTTNNHHYF